MSIEGVKEVIYKAIEDEEFKKELISNPLECLKTFDLTDEEKGRFNNINNDVITMFKNNIDQRMSKAGSGGEMQDEFDWWVESVTD